MDARYQAPSLYLGSNVAVMRASDVGDRLCHLIGHEQRENLVLIALDTGMRVIEAGVMSVGGKAQTTVCLPTCMRWALTRERVASFIVMAHNHPSGDPKPSDQDIEATKKMAEACIGVGLILQDHVVVGRVAWQSIREACPYAFL